MEALILVAKVCLGVSVAVLALYAIRHYFLSFFRLTLKRPRDTMELAGYYMPRISVVVPMHNEEKVAADVLQALVDCDYDWNKLEILAVNDRSQDRTGAIIDEFAARYPIIKAVHRQEGNGGKPGALEYTMPRATGEIIILFDADYLPGRVMLKLLVAPFADPEVGAVMGRVVPHNAGASLLAALLSLERSAGYQIGQQARYHLDFTPLFGGTVGGVRLSALRAVGGWNTQSLTEDTDLTFRLRLAGWKVGYVNRAECYEEVPETWPVRRHQIMRWAIGHTECLHRYWRALLQSKHLRPAEKLDTLFVLGCYWTAPVLVLGWLASLVLFFSPEAHAVPALAIALAFLTYQLFSSQATFFEIGAAALLDARGTRVLLVPFSLFSFFASTAAIVLALSKFYLGGLFGSNGHSWRKTARYRANGNGGNGARPRNGNGAKLLMRGSSGLYQAWEATPQ